MKTEISAGGILIRKHGVIWYVLVFRDMNETLTFPKGKIESGEDPVMAARREIQEEVGLTKIKRIMELPKVRYSYKRNGLISKVVHYFLFTVSGSEKLTPQKEEAIHDLHWLALSKALDIIGYPETNIPLLQKVEQWTSHPHQTSKK
jgi:8-oxo-dGTP pyrophosphatase MutT (NUDIX family)